MSAALYHFTIEQGATWSIGFVWKNEAGDVVDLTGYTARMKLRTVPADAEAVSLTTENGGISIVGASGTVIPTISASATAALTPGAYRYDLELVTGSTVHRLVEGVATVSSERTR